MRVRKKLMVLHTFFTVVLAAILLITLGPSLTGLIHDAEMDKARTALGMLSTTDRLPSLSERELPQGVTVLRDRQAERLLTREQLVSLRANPGEMLDLGGSINLWGVISTGWNGLRGRQANADGTADMTRAGVWRPETPPGVLPKNRGSLTLVELSIPAARTASARLFALVVATLLAVYVLVAAALEVLVLPGALYAPIERLLRADRAVQGSRTAEELIPERDIPGDEFGSIMRSRNASVLALRASERRLANALKDLELVAAELKRKNHLLETARRNLEGADRLASLGMMSAGIAHELNTPLAVLKGLSERIGERPAKRATQEESELMQRVVGRLERLGESLLDFARVREPRAERVMLSVVVSEAITLVRLDRKGLAVEIRNEVGERVCVLGDPDRLVQVFVNLIRNAVDAVASVQSSPTSPSRGWVCIKAGSPPSDGSQDRASQHPGATWVEVLVEDSGPGLDPRVIPRLFEPFFSTRLDARGTGLGLAVAEGIVREHGGVLVGRNREDRQGAVFEITLPAAGMVLNDDSSASQAAEETDHQEPHA